MCLIESSGDLKLDYVVRLIKYVHETLKVIQLLYLYIKWLCRVSRADVSEHIKWIWVRIWLVMIGLFRIWANTYSWFPIYSPASTIWHPPCIDFGLKNLLKTAVGYLFIYFGWIWAESSYSRARDGPRKIGDRSQLCGAGLLAYKADDLLRLGWQAGWAIGLLHIADVGLGLVNKYFVAH